MLLKNFYDVKKMEAISTTSTQLEKTQVPPIIGCLVADKDGKTLLKFEAFEGALNRHLQNDKRSDVELIPMFVSAMAKMSTHFNFQELFMLDVKSTNFTMTVFFLEKYFITFLSRVGVKVNGIEVRNFFTQFFQKHDDILNKYFQRGVIVQEDNLTGEGNCWIKTLNDSSTCSKSARDMSYL